MKRLITTAVMALFMGISAQAALVTFNFQTSPSGSAPDLIDNPLNFSGSGSEAGVSFNADLQVSSSAILLTDANGIGIFGNTTEINALESLLFASPTITTATGGTATFTGFNSISFAEFNTGDLGTVNGANVSADGPFALANAATINVAGVSNDAVAPGFQVTQVVADFTVVPTATGVAGVPEPSSFAALLLIGGCAVSRRRRRK